MKVEKKFTDWWDSTFFPRFTWVVGLLIAAVMAYALWDEERHNIWSLLVVALILIAHILDALPWQAWAAICGALFWMYTYRRNKRRQEEIIRLLWEIREKLSGRD